MIVLDTNVISEIMKPRFDPKVFSWMEGQPMDELFATAITKAEILYGIAILPDGRRKAQLRSAVEAVFARELRNRVLPFDDVAAEHYADIFSRRRAMGRPTQAADAQIAAIARAQGMALATRNTSDFAACGLTLVDPWQDTPDAR